MTHSMQRTGEEMASSLRRLLDAIQDDDNEVTATAMTRHRIEGALVAVETLLGQRSSLLDDLSTDAAQVDLR